MDRDKIDDQAGQECIDVFERLDLTVQEIAEVLDVLAQTLAVILAKKIVRRESAPSN